MHPLLAKFPRRQSQPQVGTANASAIMTLPQHYSSNSSNNSNYAHYTANTLANYFSYDGGGGGGVGGGGSSGVQHSQRFLPTSATTTTTTMGPTQLDNNVCQQRISQEQQQQQHKQQQQQQHQKHQRLSMPIIVQSEGGDMSRGNSGYWGATLQHPLSYGHGRSAHGYGKPQILSQGSRHSTLDRKSAVNAIKFLADSKPTYCNGAATTTTVTMANESMQLQKKIHQQQQKIYQQQQQQQQGAHNCGDLPPPIGMGAHHGNPASHPLSSSVLTSSTSGNKMLINQKGQNRFGQLPSNASESAQTTYRRLSSDMSRKFDYRTGKSSSNSYCSKEHQYFKSGHNSAPPSATFSLPQTSLTDPYGHHENSTDESLVLTENYRPISPPAEYATGSSKKVFTSLPPLPAVPPSPKTRAAVGSRLANKANNRSSFRYNYQRSQSHSHEMSTGESINATYGSVAQNSMFNINSHKSLPDLHSQICRHSPHSEVFSCCSRGNKSIKSVGAESSLNRDSGSSGHYTHRSEPCYRMYESGGSSSNNNNPNGGSNNSNFKSGYNNSSDYRRDSGSSTQHTPISYCGYITTSPMSSPYHDYLRSAIECAQCIAKQQQQQEQQQSQQQQQHHHQHHYQHQKSQYQHQHTLSQQQQQQQQQQYLSHEENISNLDSISDYRMNFATLEVPNAFKDDYKPILSPPAYATKSTYKTTSSGNQSPCHQYNMGSAHNMHYNKQQQQYHYQQQQQQQQQQQHHHHQQQQQQFMHHYHQQQQQQQQQQQLMKLISMQQSPTSVQLPPEDISPPSMQFKRQKCIRFKNRQQPRFLLGEHNCSNAFEPFLLPPPTPPPSANNTELSDNVFSCNTDGQHQLHQSQQQQQQQHFFSFPKEYIGENRRLSNNSQADIEAKNKNLKPKYATNELLSPPRHLWPPLPARDYEPLHEDYGSVSDDILELEKFFDRLGLNDDTFYEVYVRNRRRHNGSGSDSDNSSTVFFSDVSTVDSMRLPDSTETQISTTQAYRPTEPLSIVERNARIIKWLCNVRKAQNI